MGQLILLTMLFLPVAAAVVIFLLGSHAIKLIKQIALIATLITFILTATICIQYQPAGSDERAAATAQAPFQPDPNFTIDKSWLTFQHGDHPVEIRFHIGVDGLSLWLIGLTALLMVPSVLISWEAITDAPAGFYGLLLILESGLLGVFCSYDIILFYVFFEFTLLPLFFIIGIWGGPQKRYAARKFFIYTLAGSLLSLVALVSLIFARASLDNGAISFSILDLVKNTFANGSIDYGLQKWIFLGLFIGFAIKVPLFPFHTWLPLAHTEAPTAGSVILAGVLLKLGTYGFLRLCLPLLPEVSMQFGLPLIAWLSIIGIIYGALCALAQDDIKKLVAYSSVSHLGFCMIGLFALNQEGITLFALNQEGITGSVLQMVNHGLSTGMLFLIVGMVYDRYHTRSLKEMSGLGAQLKLITAFMVFACLSSAGLPGLNGFVGEFLCLAGIWEVRPLYAILAATGVILGAWYLLTMLQKAFFGPLKEPIHTSTTTIEAGDQQAGGTVAHASAAAPAHAADAHGHHGHGDEPVHTSSTPDLNLREAAILIPICIFCVWIGVYPKTFIDPMKPEVTALAERFGAVHPTKPIEPAPRADHHGH
jgi:NADH-quinone oxidoreductase subunit M